MSTTPRFRVRPVFLSLLALALVAGPALAQPFCTRTATVLLRACENDVRDDFWEMSAHCLNLVDAEDEGDCREEALDGVAESRKECMDQHEARLEVCEALGEERYDPDFEPADFTDEFDNSNPFWLLEVGSHWVFENEDETITIEVMDATKNIEGVTCIVVNDVVAEDDVVIEDTDDWFAQALNGDVWYFGEIAVNAEVFEGDDPEEPEVVDVDGSWKAGRDGAQPGIIMPRFPEVGTTFRQEVLYGEAEDLAEVLSTTYSFGDDPELDELVPEELAELLCDDDCVVTRDFTPIEPGVEEFKYYAPGIGLFLEIDRDEEEVTQLVECNVDPRCDMLPEFDD